MPSACAPWSGRCHSSTPADASSAFRHRGSTGPAAGRRETAAASVAMFSYCSDIARKRPIPLHQPAGGRRYPASPRQRCAVKNATAHVPLDGQQSSRGRIWRPIPALSGTRSANHQRGAARRRAAGNHRLSQRDLMRMAEQFDFIIVVAGAFRHRQRGSLISLTDFGVRAPNSTMPTGQTENER